jgi:hypothetical protein
MVFLKKEIKERIRERKIRNIRIRKVGSLEDLKLKRINWDIFVEVREL